MPLTRGWAALIRMMPECQEGHGRHFSRALVSRILQGEEKFPFGKFFPKLRRSMSLHDGLFVPVSGKPQYRDMIRTLTPAWAMRTLQSREKTFQCLRCMAKKHEPDPWHAKDGKLTKHFHSHDNDTVLSLTSPEEALTMYIEKYPIAPKSANATELPPNNVPVVFVAHEISTVLTLELKWMHNNAIQSCVVGKFPSGDDLDPDANRDGWIELVTRTYSLTVAKVNNVALVKVSDPLTSFLRRLGADLLREKSRWLVRQINSQAKEVARMIKENGNAGNAVIYEPGKGNFDHAYCLVKSRAQLHPDDQDIKEVFQVISPLARIAEVRSPSWTVVILLRLALDYGGEYRWEPQSRRFTCDEPDTDQFPDWRPSDVRKMVLARVHKAFRNLSFEHVAAFLSDPDTKKYAEAAGMDQGERTSFLSQFIRNLTPMEPSPHFPDQAAELAAWEQINNQVALDSFETLIELHTKRNRNFWAQNQSFGRVKCVSQTTELLSFEPFVCPPDLALGLALEPKTTTTTTTTTPARVAATTNAPAGEATTTTPAPVAPVRTEPPPPKRRRS
jgi:hypothetical protein